MSTTTQETADSQAAAAAKQDKIDKKKLKLLKSALKDEKAAKELIEKQLSEALLKIE
jgi:hypothetical protein